MQEKITGRILDKPARAKKINKTIIIQESNYKRKNIEREQDKQSSKLIKTELKTKNDDKKSRHENYTVILFFSNNI